MFLLQSKEEAYLAKALTSISSIGFGKSSSQPENLSSNRFSTQVAFIFL